MKKAVKKIGPGVNSVELLKVFVLYFFVYTCIDNVV
jgi:hypothetical protein